MAGLALLKSTACWPVPKSAFQVTFKCLCTALGVLTTPQRHASDPLCNVQWGFKDQVLILFRYVKANNQEATGTEKVGHYSQFPGGGGRHTVRGHTGMCQAGQEAGALAVVFMVRNG